jgi:hypothetical protein
MSFLAAGDHGLDRLTIHRLRQAAGLEIGPCGSDGGRILLIGA